MDEPWKHYAKQNKAVTKVQILHESTCMRYLNICLVVAQSYPTLCEPIQCSPPGSSIYGFSSKNTGVGCHFLLQGIFLSQALNPGHLHCRHSLLLSQKGSLEESGLGTFVETESRTPRSGPGDRGRLLFNEKFLFSMLKWIVVNIPNAIESHTYNGKF